MCFLPTRQNRHRSSSVCKRNSPALAAPLSAGRGDSQPIHVHLSMRAARWMQYYADWQSYFTLPVIIRLSARRTLAQMTPFDLAIVLVISETTQQEMLGDDFSI